MNISWSLVSCSPFTFIRVSTTPSIDQHPGHVSPSPQRRGGPLYTLQIILASFQKSVATEENHCYSAASIYRVIVSETGYRTPVVEGQHVPDAPRIFRTTACQGCVCETWDTHCVFYVHSCLLWFMEDDMLSTGAQTYNPQRVQARNIYQIDRAANIYNKYIETIYHKAYRFDIGVIRDPKNRAPICVSCNNATHNPVRSEDVATRCCATAGLCRIVCHKTWNLVTYGHHTRHHVARSTSMQRTQMVTCGLGRCSTMVTAYIAVRTYTVIISTR